jgi:hypothetical protein
MLAPPMATLRHRRLVTILVEDRPPLLPRTRRRLADVRPE